ncbi:MAG TPA: GlxA family transcriptional regulator [Acetobacteraceae bacterium]|nr:GlxA family transcriptional regulator [Acetobacteraceae bacterium]
MDLARLRRFGFLTLPNYSMIACANAIEALRMANRLRDEAAYEWQVVTTDGVPATASNGMMLHPTVLLETAAPFDILFVCGGIDVRQSVSRPVLTVLRRLARQGIPLGALCTGSFALAEARLLRGYRCAIHWENLDAVREEFPDTDFVTGMFTIDRDRATCTGGIAPLDMMLEIIAARFGRSLAARISAQFLVARDRDGASPQPTLARAAAPHPQLEKAVRLLEETPDQPMSAGEIAQRTNISARQIERLFRKHLGQSPAAFSTGLRLDRARTLLRETGLPVTEIGIACGFASASHFSAAFRARFGHPPRAERQIGSSSSQTSHRPS